MRLTSFDQRPEPEPHTTRIFGIMNALSLLKPKTKPEMKTCFLTVAIIAVITHLSMAQPTHNGTIVVFRENSSKGINIVHELYLDDSLVTTISNNSAYNIVCKPGSHTLRLNEFRYTTINIEVNPGETLYYKLSMQRISGVDIPSLKEVDENTATNSMYSTTTKAASQVKGRNHPSPTMLPTTRRIGLGVNLGVGINTIPIGTTNTGAPVSFSFGGGYAINAKYGRVYKERIDLAFDLSYQFSEISPSVSGIDIRFSRAIFSITPSYIIKLGHSERSFIKIGAGGAYYFNSSLKLETAKLPNGIDDKWVYKKAYGGHITVLYEMRLSKKISMNFGLKGYYVSYSFSKGQQSQPATNDFRNPDGSGVDILTGINYHF